MCVDSACVVQTAFVYSEAPHLFYVNIWYVMLRRVNFYSICFAFGLSILLIFAGSRYTDNTYYRPSLESRRNIKNFVKVDDGDYGSMLPIPTNSSMTIEKLLEQSKFKIKTQLSSYNYKESSVNDLDDLLMESGGHPLRSLIISTWRSGTTFLGELLNAVPGTFYHYEPLLSYGITQIRGAPQADGALSTIKEMFKCNFQGMDDYFEFGRTHTYQFTHNTRLWDHCNHKKDLCIDADFTSKFCRLFPFQTMKVVRVRLRLVKEILEDNELNVKVVLLIRDPRAVMQSRQHRDFCMPSPDCWQPELLCADMISDYVAAGRLLPKYPDRLLVVRYEELALNPNATAHRILKFLKLSATASVEEFLQSHTKVEVGGVSSTFRVSKEVPFRWKNALNFTDVDKIQTACQGAMDLWGYKMAYNASHMASKNFYPLDDYTIVP